MKSSTTQSSDTDDGAAANLEMRGSRKNTPSNVRKEKFDPHDNFNGCIIHFEEMKNSDDCRWRTLGSFVSET